MLQNIRQWAYKRRKSLAIFIVITFFSTYTYAAFPVSVTNFHVLIGLMQSYITKVITSKMDNIFDKEMRLKRLVGLIAPERISYIFTHLDFSKYIGKFQVVFSKYFDGFGTNKDLKVGENTWKEVVENPPSFPAISTASKSPSEYMGQARKISVLLAGKPVKVPEEVKNAQKNDSFQQKAEYETISLSKQANIQCFENASNAVIIAQNFEKEIKKINPAKIDTAMPEQAIKDTAKLLYYNALLQASLLKTMALAEQRNAFAYK